MANDVNGNPLYFDEAGSKTGLLFIKSISWTSNEGAGLDIAADDDFLVSDSKGRVIIGKRAEAAGDDLHIDYGEKGKPVNGVTVTTINGGVCFIELR